MRIKNFKIAWINLLTLYLMFSELHSECCHDLVWQPRITQLLAFNDERRLVVSWLVNQSVPVADIHQIQISRTEDHIIVYNMNVSGHSLNSSEYKWTWISDLPLQCVDHSVRVRHFYTPSHPSPWSPWAINPGVKAEDETKMFPVDEVLREGSTAMYCCVPLAGVNITSISINDAEQRLLSIGARVKAIIVENLQVPKNFLQVQELTCTDSTGKSNKVWNKVGFPPQKPRNLSCSTYDMTTVTCTWHPGGVQQSDVDNHLTCTLHIENSDQAPINCKSSSCHFSVIPELREYHVTLKVKNNLGEEADTYSFNITDRVFPVVKWHSVSPGVTNATLSWVIQGNLSELDLRCEIIEDMGRATQVHCRSVDRPCKYEVERLLPNTRYSVSVRCSVNGRLWGNGTQTVFMTLPLVTVNLWRRINSMCDSLRRNVTLMWTPEVPGSADTMTIIGYTVQGWQKDKTLWMDSGKTEAEVCVGPEQHTLTVKASVPTGSSIPAHVIIPKMDDRENLLKEMQLTSSSDGGFNLSWTAYANATCGYTVEWYIVGNTPPSPLQWKTIPRGYNSLQLPADHFRAGRRYTFNIYGCTENGHKLLEIQTGYSQETVMVPRPRLVEPVQKTSSSVTLYWHYDEDDDSNPAFIIGYLVKVEDVGPNEQPGSRKVFNMRVLDPQRKFVTVEGLKQDHDYNFTVSALTKKGSGPAVSIIIRTRINYSTLWVGLLIFVLSLLGCTVLLCSQRKLLKRKLTEVFVYPVGMNIKTLELQRFLEQTGEFVQPHRIEDSVSCEIQIIKFLPGVNETSSTLRCPVAVTAPFPASLSLPSPSSLTTPSCMPVQDYSPQLVTLIQKGPDLQQVSDVANMSYFQSVVQDFPEAEGETMSGGVTLDLGSSDCQQESCIVTYGYISNEIL